MNSRIEKDIVFRAAVHLNNKFYTNTYLATMSLLVDDCKFTDEPVIAFERVHYFLETHINDAIFICQDEVEMIDRYNKANINVIPFPEEPTDEVVTGIILLKLNSIMEGRLHITDMLLSSTLSDGIRYNVVSEIAESIYGSGNFWWNKSCTLTDNEHLLEAQPNVVHLFEKNHWEDLGLEYPDKNTIEFDNSQTI